MREAGRHRADPAPAWTGGLVCDMHLYDVTRDDLAEELKCSRGYVCMVLNGQKTPKGGPERFRSALDAILARRGYGARV